MRANRKGQAAREGEGEADLKPGEAQAAESLAKGATLRAELDAAVAALEAAEKRWLLDLLQVPPQRRDVAALEAAEKRWMEAREALATWQWEKQP